MSLAAKTYNSYTQYVLQELTGRLLFVRMKKEQQEICDSIKLTQSKMAENERVLHSLHTERDELKRKLEYAERNLKNDADCLPLRKQVPMTVEGPIITIPFMTI